MDSILIISGHVLQSPAPSDMVQAVYKNHQEYADWNLYNYHFFSERPDRKRPKEWAKLPILRRFMSDNKSHDWILWIDSDAVFVNKFSSITNVLRNYASDENIHLIISGDTCIINTGLLLLKKSKWMQRLLKEIWEIGFKMDRYPQIGMGYDNAAFAIAIAGCKSTSTYDEMKRCYHQADIGYMNKTAQQLIQAGDETVIARALSADVRPHVKLVPQIVFNCYNFSEATFVVHYPGYKRVYKNYLIKTTLERIANKSMTMIA